MPKLLAESGFYGNSLAALGAAPGNYSAAALGLHTGAKAVRLRATTTVRLECAFRHEKSCAPVMSSAIWVNGKYKRRGENGKPGPWELRVGSVTGGGLLRAIRSDRNSDEIDSLS
jgi:hypothetical protein